MKSSSWCEQANDASGCDWLLVAVSMTAPVCLLLTPTFELGTHLTYLPSFLVLQLSVHFLSSSPSPFLLLHIASPAISAGFIPGALDTALSTHKPIEVKGPGGKATIIHAQYNTPISMYSQDAIMDAIAGQTQGKGHDAG